MGRFSPTTKGRAWLATIHIANMENAGLEKDAYENPEYIADFFIELWRSSGKDRTSGVAVCVSEKGLYHLHMALYGNTTTLNNVSKILFNSHVEPQLGGKKELTDYLNKSGKYAEKGEMVLYTKGLEEIQDNQGNRSDLCEIETYLQEGLKPEEIFEISFRFRRLEKQIKAQYISLKTKNTPLIKKMQNEYHVGESGSGKTFYYVQLCEKYEADNIYLCNDFENGGMDYYLERGCPDILFIDEFKGNMRFSQLLSMLDKYSRSQTHARYNNIYNLWTKTIITSVYPPEQVYSYMVDEGRRGIDSIKQLLRRLDVIVYHYKQGDEYKSYSIPACEYKDYDDLKQRALTNENGFINLGDTDINPFVAEMKEV